MTSSVIPVLVRGPPGLSQSTLKIPSKVCDSRSNEGSKQQQGGPWEGTKINHNHPLSLNRTCWETFTA